MTTTVGMAERVDVVFRDCLWNDEEMKEKTREDLAKVSVIADGIMMKVGFHPVRLESHRAEVIELLKDLDPKFMTKESGIVGAGGGFTFMAMPFDKHGEQWGEQSNAEQLLLLALGLDLAKFPFRREMWGVFPGGVPYITIIIPPVEQEEDEVRPEP